MAKNTATSAFFGIFRKNNQNARSIRLWRGISGSLIFSYNTARYREVMTLEISLRESAQGFESLPLRQKTRLSRSKSRKDFLAAFVFENMEGGTYELFKL